MANSHAANQTMTESVLGVDCQLTQIDDAELLVHQQLPDVKESASMTGDVEGPEIAHNGTGDISVVLSAKSYPVDISSPELFTGASPLGVDLTGQVLTRGPSLANRLRSRLPSVNVVLACVAFWVSGFVPGIIAFVLELKSRAKLSSGSVDDQKKAQRLRKASRVVSVVAIVVGIVISITVYCSIVIPLQYHDDDYNYPLSYDGESVSELSQEQCSGIGLDFVEGKCYRNSSSIMSCSTCLAMAGEYVKGICYFNMNDCPGYTLASSSQHKPCFTSRRPALNWECSDNEVYASGYCYYTPIPDCKDGYFVGCKCYSQYSTTFTVNTCTNIGGAYSKGRNYTYHLDDGRLVEVRAKTCYFNGVDCSGYSINGQCYSHTTAYTTGTCQNIGGYMDTNSGLCYNDGFDCGRYFPLEGQCYASVVYTSCSSCINMGGHITRPPAVHFVSSGSLRTVGCYLYDKYMPWDKRSRSCNSSYFSDIAGVCETNRSTAYNSSQCIDIGGSHNSTTGYCYFTPMNCPGYVFGCNCYKYRDTASSLTKCTNFGGKFVAQQTCYYNSTKCVHYEFQGECYNDMNVGISQSDCKGAFDEFYGICYYNHIY